MKIGFVGLGKMGGNMVKRLVGGGHEVAAHDPGEEARRAAEEAGARTFGSLAELVAVLEPPRALWVMVPAGKITEGVVTEALTLLEKGDVLVDGGNSLYKDTMRRAAAAGARGVDFLDVGTSGGIWGLDIGYCMMIGGRQEAFRRLEPALATLAPKDGYAHVGPAGAGHYVKMVHNAVEYAMLEAYGEGFEIMAAKEEFNLDLAQIARLWNQGSVIRSWLLELAAAAFGREGRLDSVRGYVEDTGEGRWSVLEAIEENVPAPAITLSLLQRFRSRQEESFSAKVIAALRNEFGGHGFRKA